MSLQCNITLNYASYTAGQNPAPMATVQVFNPNASPVSVTNMQIYSRVQNGSTVNTSTMLPSVPPIGPGMTTLVPALSSINIGPFPVVVGSGANVNSFQAVNQAGNLNPINPQASQPAQFILKIGAVVQGSDGSFNEAGQAALLVSYASNPPQAFQGGYLQFSAPNNLSSFVLTGAL